MASRTGILRKSPSQPLESLSQSDGGPLRFPPGAPTILPQALQRAAEHSPARGILYLHPDGEAHQSYAALLEQARRICGGLRAHELQPGDMVLFQLQSASELVAAFWGCMLAGVVPAPTTAVTGSDALQPAARRFLEARAVLGRTRILCSASLAPALRTLLASTGTPGPDVLVLEELLRGRPAAREHPSAPEDLALLLLTSGSTARPKAVMLSHANLLGGAQAAAQRHSFTHSDVSLNWMPLEHVGGLVMFHLRDVVTGCQQIHVPTEAILQSPLLWLDLVHRHRVSLTWAPNFAYGLVNDQAASMAGRDWDLRCLRLVLNAGETIVPKTARRFLELLAPFGLPETAMHPAWGMSETSSGVTYSERFSRHTTSDADAWVEVGTPLPGMAVRITDTEDRIVPEGETGALQVRGVAVTSGYCNDSESTRSSFTADGWLRTGDVGFLREGRLTLTGREKDIVIVHGVNYSCHRIEAAVEEVEGVETSFTAACATRVPGDQTDKLVIFYSSPLTGAEAERELAERIRATLLRDIGIHAAHLVRLPREQIPKTAIGKIRRAELRRRFEAGEFAGEIAAPKMSATSGLDTSPADTPALGHRHVVDTPGHAGAPAPPSGFHRRVWCEIASPAPRSPPAGPWLLFTDTLGLGEELARRLGEEGHAVTTVVAEKKFSCRGPGQYCLDPHSPTDFELLFGRLEKEGLSPRQYVHLWTYGAILQLSSAIELEERQALGLHSVLHLAQSLARGARDGLTRKLWVVSNSAYEVLPGEGVACEKTALPGLLKTLPREIPGLEVVHVDLAGTKETGKPDDLYRELGLGAVSTEIAYRDGRRWCMRLVAVEVQPGPAPATDAPSTAAPNTAPSIAAQSTIPSTTVPVATALGSGAPGTPLLTGGFYIVSGGLGGIGIAIVRELLGQYRARLLVIGRRRMTEVEETLGALRGLGGEVLYHSADIADAEAVSAALQDGMRRWGQAPDGVFHLAGTYEALAITDETITTLAQALRAKVLGAWVLHQLLEERTGALFVSFSSLLADSGGALHGAYAAANAFLVGLAHQQRSLGMRAHSMLWSSWTNTGMNRGDVYDAALRAQGSVPLDPADGMASLWAALRAEEPHILIGLDASNPRIRQRLESAASVTDSIVATRAPETLSSSEPSPRSLPQDFAGPRTETERKLIRIWEELLEHQHIGVRDNLFDCGGDSLLAVRIVAEIEAVFGLRVPTAALFRAPTVELLAAVIERAPPRRYRVVPLQPEGRRLPFFCLPGGQDDSMVFRGLAAEMDAEQPLYGLQAAVLDGTEPCASTLSVEEVATHFMKEIRSVQPLGPYRLGGHCLGGLVAFEVAQQLWAAGVEVEFLALIDTLVYDSTPTHVVPPMRLRLKSHWRELSSRSWNGKLGYLVEKVGSYRDTRESRRRTRRAVASIEDMHRRYHPRPYPGRLTLFLAADSFLGRDPRRDPRRRWRGLAEQGAEVILVAGDHETLLKPPFVADLATRLGHALASQVAPRN